MDEKTATVEGDIIPLKGYGWCAVSFGGITGKGRTFEEAKADYRQKAEAHTRGDD